mmetsp:Transcript_17121/g.30589  ORF Transcript_17121/g.30589 Transcript_17121/m.30589 type:complete len:82 (-) Transcript_17121:697-942(-)
MSSGRWSGDWSLSRPPLLQMVSHLQGVRLTDPAPILFIPAPTKNLPQPSVSWQRHFRRQILGFQVQDWWIDHAVQSTKPTG